MNNCLHLNNEIRHNNLCKELKINPCFNSKFIQIFNINYKDKEIKIIYFHISNINNNFEDLKLAVIGKKDKTIKLKNRNIGIEKWYKNKYIEFLEKYHI